MSGAKPDPSASEDFLSGRPVPVDPVRIERELSALWKPLSEASGGREPVVRACTANLIVWTEAVRDLARTERQLAALGRRCPNRTILLLAPREGAPTRPGTAREAGRAGRDPEVPSLRASITAICHAPAPGVAPVCCEQIRLAASGRKSELLAGAVAPLLVSELPVVLWWQGEYRDPALVALAEGCDGLVVDSRSLVPDTELPGRLTELRDEEVAAGATDLGWLAIAPWRQAVAEVFDDSAARGVLAATDRVEISRGPLSPSGARDDSGLLAAWIVYRLGWKVREVRFEGDAIVWRARCGRSRERRVSILAGSDGSPAREGSPTTAIRFRAGAEADSPFVAVERDDRGERGARIVCRTERLCRLPRGVPLRFAEDSDLLGRLVVSGAGGHPAAVVDAARRLAGGVPLEEPAP